MKSGALRLRSVTQGPRWGSGEVEPQNHTGYSLSPNPRAEGGGAKGKDVRRLSSGRRFAHIWQPTGVSPPTLAMQGSGCLPILRADVAVCRNRDGVSGSSRAPANASASPPTVGFRASWSALASRAAGHAPCLGPFDFANRGGVLSVPD